MCVRVVPAVARVALFSFLVAGLAIGQGAPAQSEARHHKWAFYTYGLNGSDLVVYQMAFYDWLRLRRSKPSDDVAVLGLRDLPLALTRYYRVTSEGHEVLERRETNENTGNPQSLHDFLVWATHQDVGARTCLLFSGHGSGSVLGGLPALPEDRAFISRVNGPNFDGLGDEVPHSPSDEVPSGGGLGPGGEMRDLLTMAELLAALDSVPGLGKVDVIAFQACQMQNLEALYEVRDKASYFVGSEESMRNSPFPLTELIEHLSENPDIDGSTYGRFFVDCAFSSTTFRILTLSCVDAAKLSGVAEHVNTLAQALLDLPVWTQPQWSSEERKMVQGIIECGDKAIPMGSDKYVDLFLLAKEIGRWAREHGAERVACEAELLMGSVTEAVLVTRSRGNCAGCGGLSIYFPAVRTPGLWQRMRGKTQWEPLSTDDQYQRTSFAKDNAWDEFIAVLSRTAWERLQ